MNTNNCFRTFVMGLMVVGMIGLLALPVQAQEETVQLEFTGESSMKITGSSTVHDWTCAEITTNGTIQLAPSVVQDGAVVPTALIENIRDTGPTAPSASLLVPVKKMSCEKSGMDSRMYNALKSKKHSTIDYQMESVQLDEVNQEERTMTLSTTGDVTIAGKTQSIDMSVKAEATADTRLVVSGKKDLKMSDFKVERPTAMFGTIQAYDDVTVHFEMIAERVE